MSYIMHNNCRVSSFIHNLLIMLNCINSFDNVKVLNTSLITDFVRQL